MEEKSPRQEEIEKRYALSAAWGVPIAIGLVTFFCARSHFHEGAKKQDREFYERMIDQEESIIRSYTAELVTRREYAMARDFTNDRLREINKNKVAILGLSWK